MLELAPDVVVAVLACIGLSIASCRSRRGQSGSCCIAPTPSGVYSFLPTLTYLLFRSIANSHYMLTIAVPTHPGIIPLWWDTEFGGGTAITRQHMIASTKSGMAEESLSASVLCRPFG